MKTAQKQTIIWLASYLKGIGGGQKLLFEGVEYFRKQGYRVVIITWHFDELALFNGTYSKDDIIILNEPVIDKKHIFQRAFNRLKSLWQVKKIMETINPSMVFTQSEYDVAIAYLLSFFAPLPYCFLIFGQMFQYPDDMAKYALVFKKHLKTIVYSQEGYKNTIPLKRPKMNLLDWFSNEIICLIRYFAVQNAQARFVFSKSQQWETKLLFKQNAVILKGAFSENIFNQTFDNETIKEKYEFPENRKILLSMSRLQAKKRIDVMLEALQNLDKSYVLLIAGSGEDDQKLRDLSQRLEVQNQVMFLGHIPENDARALQNACDIFISMDIGDYDISPMEALALGKKTIIPMEFDLDPNLQKIDYLAISPANATNLAKTIVQLYQQKTSFKKDLLQLYTWKNYFKKIAFHTNI